MKLFRLVPVPGTSGILEENEVLLCSQIRTLFFVKAIPNLMEMKDWRRGIFCRLWEALLSSKCLHSKGQ